MNTPTLKIISPSVVHDIKQRHLPVLHVLHPVWDRHGNLICTVGESEPATGYDADALYVCAIRAGRRAAPRGVQFLDDTESPTVLLTRPFYVQYTHRNIVYVVTPYQLYAYQQVLCSTGRLRIQTILSQFNSGSIPIEDGTIAFSDKAVSERPVPDILLAHFSMLETCFKVFRFDIYPMFAVEVAIDGQVSKTSPFDGEAVRDTKLYMPLSELPDVLYMPTGEPQVFNEVRPEHALKDIRKKLIELFSAHRDADSNSEHLRIHFRYMALMNDAYSVYCRVVGAGPLYIKRAGRRVMDDGAVERWSEMMIGIYN